MSGTESVFDARRWERHEGVTVVECPSCGFCMDADHEDTSGGYSCPNCEVTRLYTALRRIAYQPFDVNASSVSELAEAKAIAADAVRHG